MATPVLSRLRRVLVWAKAANASPKVRSSRSDNLFIPLLVGREWVTLQPLHGSKSHRAETGRASQPPVACKGSSRPAAVIHTASAGSLFATLRCLSKTNSPCATSPLRRRYELSASANLSNWQSLGTILMTNNVVEFDDTNSAG